MKKYSSCIGVVLIFVGATNVIAASSTDLTISGSITPSACTPLLSNGGVVDHGKISINELRNNITALPKVTLQMSISCDAATLLAIRSTDNREGTAVDSDGHDGTSAFGLGLSDDNQKLGGYTLTMENAMTDGVTLPLVETVNGSTWFSAPAGQVWQPGWMRSVSSAGNRDNTPVAMQNLVADVVVATTIKKPTMTTEEIPLDGSATLDIVYL